MFWLKKALFWCQYLSDLLDGTTTNHHQTMTWTTTNDDMRSSQITINHWQVVNMTWITTNHKSLHCHHKPWHKPPSRPWHWNLHKAWHESLSKSTIVTLTWCIMMTFLWKRLCIKPYGWPCYKWHCLDLIVTFLWMTLSRSNCDLFMNDTV